MTKPQVLLNHPLFENVVNEILADADVRVVDDLNRASPELQHAQAVVTLLSTRVDQAFIDAAPHLRVVANYAVGTDNIDIAACSARDIVVTNTPDVLTDATAEVAVALLFASARRIVEADAFTRRGDFVGWRPDLMLGRQLNGRRAVVVGGGRIGGRVAAILSAIGLRVSIVTRHTPAAEIDAALAEADVLTLHMPYSETTHHWLDKGRIAMLGPNAIVINTARGAVIDEDALIDALANRKIWGAGLDVYEHEPAVPERLRALDNVVLAPHIGSATHTARIDMAKLACESVVAVLDGRTPNNRVAPR